MAPNSSSSDLFPCWVRRVFCLCAIILCGAFFFGASAQDSRAKRTAEGLVVDSLSGQPLPAAHITLQTSWGDTIRSTTDRAGRFLMEYAAGRTQDFSSRIVIEVSYLGYSPWTRTIEPVPDRCEVKVRMAPQAVAIDEVSVKGRAVLITSKGDTIVYNAAAINSTEQETAGDLVKKLPGITVEEHGNKKTLSYNGERIEVVFVNGRLVFGSDVTDAMDYVQAKDVNKIQVFDQKDQTRKKRRRVMNILTFSNLVGTIAGEVLLSGGADTEKDMEGERRTRYGAGGSYNIFATKHIVKLKALTSNIDRHTTQIAQMAKLGEGRYSGYRQNVEAEAVYEYSPSAERMEYGAGGGDHLHIDYGFNRQNQEDRKFSDYIYFPSEAWKSRTSSDTTQTQIRNWAHTLNVRATKYLGKRKSTIVNFFSNNFLRDDRDEYAHRLRSILDEQPLYATDLLDDGRNKSWGSTGSLSMFSVLDGNSRFKLLADFKYIYSDNDGEELQLDTLEWSTSRTFINASCGTRNLTLSGNMSFIVSLGGHDISLSYSIDRTDVRYNKTAIDNLTGTLDLGLTSRYTNRSLTHKSRIGYKYMSRTGFSAEINAAISSFRMDKSEFIPSEQQYARNYLDPVVNCSVYWIHAMRTNLSFNYNNVPIYPSVEMLRAKIDNTDPLFLRSGNPSLRRAMLHTATLRLNHTIPASTSSVEVALMAKMTTDAIASRTRFFTQDTRLADHDDYLAPAGSTLLTFENVGKSYMANLAATYRFLCRPINSIISFTPTFTYESTPGYSGEDLNILQLYRTGFKAGVTANFSKKIRAELKTEAYYDMTRNSQKDDMRSFIDQTDFTINYNFLKHCYLTLNYRYYLYSGITYKDRNDYNQLNAGIGYRIFKNRMGEINLSVCDLLNSTRTYRVKTTSEYRQNIVSYYTGRYLLFTFSYRFNKKRT